MRQRLIRHIVFAGFGLSGMAALIYEVVWTRSLSIIMGSSTYALSTMLAAFMAGLSIGGLIGGRLTDRIKRLAVAFALCELGIGLFGIITVPLIKALTPVYISSYYTFHLSFGAFSAVQFALIFIIMGIPTTLMGLTFPIVVKYFTSSGESAGRQSGMLYFINTFGAIIGSVSAGFLLIPAIGVRAASVVAASLNIMTATVILLLSGESRKLPAASASVIAFFALSAVIDQPQLPVFSYYSAFRFASIDDVKSKLNSIKTSGKDFFIYRREGVEGNIYLTKYLTLINNAKWEAGDERGFSLLSYLPYASFGGGTPRSALNIGLGSGHTLSELARLPLKNVESVELSGEIIEANRQFLNPALFSDSRIRHTQADGRNFMLVKNDLYDLIIVSPSWAVESGSAQFLTDEFFALAASRLTQEGVIALWTDYFLMDDADYEIVLRTFAGRFRHVAAWHILGDNMILVGTNSERRPSGDSIRQTVLNLNPSLNGYFRAAAVDAATPGGETNTDDRPVIEFHNARRIITGPGHLQRKAGS